MGLFMVNSKGHRVQSAPEKTGLQYDTYIHAYDMKNIEKNTI